MKPPTMLNVFIGCPADMGPERSSLLSLRHHLDELGCPVRFLIWKNATPGAGDAQKVIFDNYPIANWDVFIGLLWTRFGVPSGIRDPVSGDMLTGTEAEFFGAYDAFLASGGQRPQILLYHCARDLPNNVDIEQLVGVRNFLKQTLTGGRRPALAQDFKTVEELKQRVTQDLVKVAGRLNNWAKNSAISEMRGGAEKQKPDWAGAEESYRRHLCDTHRIVKFHTAEARAPVEVELEKVYINLTAAVSGAFNRYAHVRIGGTATAEQETQFAERFGRLSVEQQEKMLSVWDEDLEGVVTSPLQMLAELKLAEALADKSIGSESQWNPIFLPDLLSRQNRVALVGSPGSGKSTLLQHLVLTFASLQQQARLQLGEERLPVLIRLRQFHRWAEDRRHVKMLGELKPADLHEFLAHQWSEEKGAPPLPRGFFLRLLHDSRALILLDGLDEIADATQRRAIAVLIATALDHWRWGRVILTSRPKAWENEGRLVLRDHFREARVCDLDDAQIDLFVRHWYLATTISARGDNLAARGHAENRAVDLIGAVKPERIHRLAVTPLMLSILAMVHSRGVGLPQERSQLYHECIEFMLGYWDEIGGFSPDIELHEVARYDRQTKRQILEPVALWMHRLGSVQIEPLHDDLVKQFAEGFQTVLNDPRPASERHARAFVRLIVERGGLMQESEAGQFRFVHLTFQEYLAASAIAHGEAPFAQVEKHLHDPWWREVILLAGGELSRQRSYRVKSDTTAWLNGILTADTWAEEYVLRDLKLAAQSDADMSETGADAKVTAEIARRLIDAVLDWWQQKPVANLSHFIRQLPGGRLTRAIASALPDMAPRGKSRYGIPSLVISHLLPDSVIDTPLVAAYIERSADENANAAWDAVLLTLKHGSAAEGQVAFARFRAGAASRDWPIAAKETSELFALGHRELGEAALSFARKIVPEAPSNQSVGWPSLLIQYGTSEDRRTTMTQMIADLAAEDSERTRRALYEFSQIAEYADTPEIREAVKRILTRLGHPRVSTSAHLLQIAAVQLWTALTNRGVTVDYTPLIPVATGPWDQHLEEAVALVLKHGSDAHRKAVLSNLNAQMTAAPAGKSSAILIFLARFDPDADLRELASWAEELAAKKEPHGAWRVWDVLRFLGEKAWTCPRSIQRLVEEAEAKDIIGRISLTRLALLLRTRPENATIRLPSVTLLAEAALYFAKEQGSVECVTALASLSELGKPIGNNVLEELNQTSALS